MKSLLAFVFVLTLFVQPSTVSAEETYPNRPIKLIQPTSAGGPTDVLIRIIADGLTTRLGQPIVVENRPGAGGAIGSTAVAKAPADGYTILSSSNLLFSSAALRTNMPYDAVKDFTGISLLSRAPLVMVANKDFPANTVAEIVELAKKSPDGLLYTSPNFGGVPFLSGQLFMRAAGIKLDHVTYSGSPAALVDVIAGRVPLMFDLWSSSKQYVEEGQLKLIAVVTNAPLLESPQTPVLNDIYPVFDFQLINALAVASQTPKPIIDRLVKEVHAVVGLPAVQKRMIGYGLTPATSTPEEYNDLAQREYKKWRDVVLSNNIKVE